ncbi:hypothetical protein [Streptomyces sp. NPDC048188]|uniref:hypothetical protein n=1 Tax=Streptomyces sp. NPDC048188 TaxID=3155749 RepID=UPI0034218D3A
MKRRSSSVAAGFAVSAALLLTACGGSDRSSDNGKSVDGEHGTRTPQQTSVPSATSTEDEPDGVDLSLPKDMNLVFDWGKPKHADEAAAMNDAANFFRAIYRGVDRRTAKDAAVTAYSTGGGLKYAQTQIEAWIEGGWTATGTLRHYDVTTRSAGNGTSVEVAFCADSSKFYGQEVETKKILTTEPSIQDFDYYTVIMAKEPTSDGPWKASKVFVDTKAEKCQ